MFAQHGFLRIRMQVDLLVHPVGHRVAAQVMLEQCPGQDHRWGTMLP